MASPTIKFITSDAVNITQGSTTINLTGGIDTYHVYDGTVVVIGESPIIAIVEGVSGMAPDVDGNSVIELREPWALPDVVNEPLVAFNSIEGLPEAIRKARELARQYLDLIEAQETLLTSTDPTVIININGTPTEFVPYQYLVDQFGA